MDLSFKRRLRYLLDRDCSSCPPLIPDNKGAPALESWTKGHLISLTTAGIKGYGAAISETLTWGGGWGAVNWFFSYSIFMGKLLQNNISWNKFSFFFEIFRAVSHRSLSCCAICLNSSRFGLWHFVTLCDRLLICGSGLVLFFVVMRIWWLGAVK